MLYSGPADDTAQVQVFQTDAAVTEALAAGWRLRRATADTDDPAPPEVVDSPPSSRKKR